MKKTLDKPSVLWYTKEVESVQYLPLVPACMLPERTESAVFVEVDWLDYDTYLDELVACNHLVILDNSVHLNGKPCDSPTLLWYADWLAKCCVIAPDEQGDYLATLELAESFMKDVRSMGIYRPTVMLVPQGKDYREFIQCYDEMVERFQPEGIAITLDSSWCLDGNKCACRNGRSKYLGSMAKSEYLGLMVEGDQYLERAHHRLRMLEQFMDDGYVGEGMYYHLLGMTHGLELAAIKRMGWDSWVSSADSAKAYTLAKAGVTIGKDGWYKDIRTVKVFDPVEVESEKVLNRAKLNISRLQGLLT